MTRHGKEVWRMVVGVALSAGMAPAVWAADARTFSTAPTGGSCIGDLNHDGQVNATDLAIVLGSWGAKGGPADLTGDGVVGEADKAMVMKYWGPCR